MTLLMRDQENIEKGREEGIREGKKEGIKKGIHAMAANVLEVTRSIGQTAILLRLSEGEVRAIAQNGGIDVNE